MTHSVLSHPDCKQSGRLQRDGNSIRERRVMEHGLYGPVTLRQIKVDLAANGIAWVDLVQEDTATVATVAVNIRRDTRGVLPSLRVVDILR